MKTQQVEAPASSLGIVDALSAGLAQARRRPWLMLIPALVDFWLWLGPRFSVQPLIERFMRSWENLLQVTYSPAQLTSIEPLLQTVRDMASQLGSHLNLGEAVTGSWMSAPSVLSLGQATRLTFLSDVVLAPAGLSPQFPEVAAAPWRFAPVQVESLGWVLLIVAGLWLAGQLMVAAYLRFAGAGWRGSQAAALAAAAPWRGMAGLLRLALRVGALSLFVSVLTVFLRLPLAFGLALLYVSANSLAGMLAVMMGGVALWLTLWFLTSVFFATEALLLEGHGLRHGLVESIRLVHRNFGRAIGLAAVINLVLYGFRIVWGLVGGTAVGVPIAILGNAYLVTGMLLASFAYFDNLRHAPVPERAKLAH